MKMRISEFDFAPFINATYFKAFSKRRPHKKLRDGA